MACELRERGIELVVRIQAERVGSQTLQSGPEGDTITWPKPNKPRGVTGEQYRSYPESLTMRQVSVAARDEDNRADRALDPGVVALRSHVTGMVEKEMLRLRGKYDDSIADDLELAMHRVTRSLLHTPTLRAQELARTGDGAGYLAALHTLFGIELTSN